MFYITKNYHGHTCKSVAPTIKKVWLRSKIAGMLAESGTITVPQLGDCFRLRFGLDVKLNILEECFRQAKNEILSANASFGTVQSFLVYVEGANPGSTIYFEAQDGEFLRAFLCPSICVNAFRNSTRVIALDCCHIKAKYGGVILAATVLDGNGSVFPAAVGVAESENEETWRWFLRLLTLALQINDDGDRMVVLSDREKGLKKAVKAYLRRASHSYCVFHILKTSRANIIVDSTVSFSKRRRPHTWMTSTRQWRQ